MDAFAGANGKMMAAFHAALQVLVQFLVEQHRGTRRVIWSKASGISRFCLGFARADLGLFDERVRLARRRCQRGFNRVQPKRFLRERSCIHLIAYNNTKGRAPLSRRKPRPRPAVRNASAHALVVAPW